MPEGEGELCQKHYRFFLVECIFSKVDILRSWVGSSGGSVHHDFSSNKKVDVKPLDPFKFNHKCLGEVEFKSLVRLHWTAFELGQEELAMRHFLNNLIDLKHVVGD